MTQVRGIYSADDLKQRCAVDDVTGCWEWKLGRDANGVPSMWFPPLRRVVTLGMVVCHLKTGRKMLKSEVWKWKCCTEHCANPAHRYPISRSAQCEQAARNRSPLALHRTTATRRAMSRLSESDVIEIRNSDETSTVLSQKYGISPSYARKIKVGIMRKPLGSSVFSWGGA